MTIDQVAPASQVIQWDVRNWSVALESWSGRCTQDLAGKRALEVGGRTGGLTLYLASQGAHVVCSDLLAPSQDAMDLHRSFGVADLVEYAQIDATQIPYEDQFDVVVFKSVLGSIGRRYGEEGQRRAIAEMHKALRKGGELLFAENLTGCSLHRIARRHFVKWGRSWRYVSIPEIEEYLAPFASFECRSFGFAGAFGRTERQRNILGILDTSLLNAVIPRGWRYIVAVVARK